MSTVTAYGLVILTVLLTAYGQFAIKWQVLASQPMPPMWGERMSYLIHLLLSPLVITAILAAFLASVSWMIAMTRLQLSHAYPMTALTFVAVLFGSNWIFGEPITAMKVYGLILIMAGILVASQG